MIYMPTVSYDTWAITSINSIWRWFSLFNSQPTNLTQDYFMLVR